MGLHNIEKRSIGYCILKIWAKFWHNKVYYRKVTILGTENIPKNKPLIFTPNHQNALMDALVLLFSYNKQFVFIARADIFKNPMIARILYFLKILPIYRVRDGFDTVKKSKDIIRKTIDIITSGSAIVILPEGNHSSFRRLRPLKKGFARMAFQAEEANDYNLDIHIVPVGIDYDHYFNPRGSVVINFGKPVAVHNYYKLYKQNKAVAINKIKEELSQHMAPLIVNIKSKDNYNTYNELRAICREDFIINHRNVVSNTENRVLIDQHLTEAVSEFEKIDHNNFLHLKDITDNYLKIRDRFGFSNKIIRNNGISLTKLIPGLLLLILMFPVFLYGFLNNIVPYKIPVIVSKKIRDEQFLSSVRYVISLLSFPIFYILQSLIVYLVTSNISVTGWYLLSLPVSAAISWKWRSLFLYSLQGIKYWYNSKVKRSQIDILKSLHYEIISKTKGIIDKYHDQPS